MLGRIEKKEIIQKLENDIRNSLIEELLRFVKKESQITKANKNAKIVILSVVTSKTDYNDAISENDNGVLDHKIRKRNKKNQDKMVKKYAI